MNTGDLYILEPQAFYHLGRYWNWAFLLLLVSHDPVNLRSSRLLLLLLREEAGAVWWIPNVWTIFAFSYLRKITRNIEERILPRELLNEKIHTAHSFPASLVVFYSRRSQDSGLWPGSSRCPARVGWELASYLTKSVPGQASAATALPTQGKKQVSQYSPWFVFLFVNSFYSVPRLLKLYFF